MNSKKKLFAAAVLLGFSLVAPAASSPRPPYCDVACPTANGFCSCPLWSDKPKAPSFCLGWNTVGGCWYE